MNQNDKRMMVLVPPSSISEQLLAVIRPDIISTLTGMFPDFRFEFATFCELQDDEQFMVFPSMGTVGAGDRVMMLPKVADHIMDSIRFEVSVFELKPARRLN